VSTISHAKPRILAILIPGNVPLRLSTDSNRQILEYRACERRVHEIERPQSKREPRPLFDYGARYGRASPPLARDFSLGASEELSSAHMHPSDPMSMLGGE
jgi:hypothetical protein